MATDAVGLAKANLHDERSNPIRVDELRDAGNDRLNVAGLHVDVVADSPWVAGGVFNAPVAAAVAGGAQNLRDRAAGPSVGPRRKSRCVRPIVPLASGGSCAGGQAGAAGRALRAVVAVMKRAPSAASRFRLAVSTVVTPYGSMKRPVS